MNREQKVAVVEEIAGQIEDAQAVFAVDYRGISVTQAAELRARLRDADASFRVVKNSLTERAADKAGADGLRALLDGPTALTFVRGDAAVAAKALSDVARATQLLAFKGGLMDGGELSADDVRSIARLPARDVLYGQLVGTVAAPLTGLVRGLNALIGGLAIQLQAISDQGLVGGGADAEAVPDAGGAEQAEETSDSAADGETEAATESSPDSGAEQPSTAEADSTQTEDSQDDTPTDATATAEPAAADDKEEA